MNPIIRCRLKEVIDERGLSLRDVATAVGSSFEPVRRLANNEFTNLPTKLVSKICDYLQMKPSELLVFPDRPVQDSKIPYEIVHYLNLGLLQQIRFLRSTIIDYSKQSNEVKFVIDREYDRLKKAMEYTDDPDLKKSFDELTQIYQSEKQKPGP